MSSYHNIFGFSQAFEPNISRALQRALWTTLSTLSRTAGIFQRYDIDYVFTVCVSKCFVSDVKFRLGISLIYISTLLLYRAAAVSCCCCIVLLQHRAAAALCCCCIVLLLHCAAAASCCCCILLLLHPAAAASCCCCILLLLHRDAACTMGTGSGRCGSERAGEPRPGASAKAAGFERAGRIARPTGALGLTHPLPRFTAL